MPTIPLVMKDSKVMLVLLSTYLLTILLCGLLVYLVAGFLTYRDAILNVPFALVMAVFGWIPAAVVATDYNELLNKREESINRFKRK